ncbi:hypothetical protein HYX70_03275 [Candidatus Saccharibacteria bacterium]|nr:hypothetical protein [Candidatus Saccharibacteria bacterium]
MCARQLNKTREVLRFISTRKVAVQSEITSSKALLELFSVGSTNARRRLIDTCALLAKQGYVSVGVLDGEHVYKINAKGQKRLESYVITQDSINRRWDGRWYLVTFDIPENEKATRNQLILTLKRVGFVNYTKGLWLLPYNPTKLINGLRKQFCLEKDQLRLIVATQLDESAAYKKLFKL